MSLDALARLKGAAKPLSTSIAVTPTAVPVAPTVTSEPITPQVIVTDPDVAEAVVSAPQVTPQLPPLLSQDMTEAEIAELTKDADDQLKRLSNDPVVNYLGVNIDDMGARQRKIFNEEAIKAATATISQLNDRYELLYQSLKDIEWQAQSVIMIKQDRIKNAKSKNDKERLIREDLAWQERKKRQTKSDKVATRTIKKRDGKVVAKSDAEIDALPTEMRNAVKSMLKTGVSKEKAMAFVREMRGGK